MKIPEEAKRIIEALGLEPHPEGGWFRRTWVSRRSTGEPLDPAEDGPRGMGSAIYFLLAGEAFSALHRLEADEMIHHYAGDAIHYVLLDQDGRRTDHLLGKDLAGGEKPQLLIPAGVWQGACAGNVKEAGFALMGCTVVPEFRWQDFEMGKREELSAEFPQHREIIERLTSPQ